MKNMIVKTNHERLIKLIQEAIPGVARYWAMQIANYLMENGVEVSVRCDKCKWFDLESEYCGFWGGVRHPEHFCGEGEMRLNSDDEYIQQEVR